MFLENYGSCGINQALFLAGKATAGPSGRRKKEKEGLGIWNTFRSARARLSTLVKLRFSHQHFSHLKKGGLAPLSPGPTVWLLFDGNAFSGSGFADDVSCLV